MDFTDLDSQATELYLDTTTSSQDTVNYYKEPLWGPIRLYKDAKFEDNTECIRWCMSNGLLLSQKHCRLHRCQRTLRDLDATSRIPFWYCGKCNNRKSMFAGSIFADTKLSIQKVLMIAYSYANNCSYEDARRNCAFSADDLDLTNRTLAHWYHLFREIVAEDHLNQSATGSKIGGQGRIVQVDEVMLGRRKYNRGRLVESTWVLGMIDEDGYIRLEIVERRDVNTLTEVISRNVQIGSIIHTDSWKGYNTDRLGWMGFKHATVNHSVEFVAPDGTHTQRIESHNRDLRRKFSPGGIRNEDITDHLLEYAWRRKCRTSRIEPFTDLIKLARAS